MSINTTNPSNNHAKSIIERLKRVNGLPFQGILSPEALEKHIEGSIYRERIFSPEMTIHTFLSQVISADPSCQAVVAQTVAQLASQEGEISANTAAYCKARSRLPESILPKGYARNNSYNWHP